MPKISVIVPVYKVEPYLHKCVDSILAQTFTDFELLLVDDGSPDNCGTICDAYAEQDNRVRVFHKSNGGVSSARNLGLDNAKGEWITFVDADDFIAPAFLEGLYRPIAIGGNVDFVQGGCVNWGREKVVGVNQKYDYLIDTNPAYVFANIRGLTVSKLFLQTNLETVKPRSDSQKIRFDEKMKIAEDMAFTLDYLLHVHRYAFVSETGYYYRIDNQTSATHNQHNIPYETELHSFRHLYNSTMAYIEKFHLTDHEAKLRLQQRGNEVLYICSNLSKYQQYDKDTRIKCMSKDFLPEQVSLLHYAHPNGWINKILRIILMRKQYALFDFVVKHLFVIKQTICKPLSVCKTR